MNTLIGSLWRRTAATLCITVGLVSLAQAFEGRVDMTMSTSKKKDNMAMVYFIKGSQLRTEMTPSDSKKSQTFVSIFNLETKEITVLMAEQQKYMVISMEGQTPKDIEGKKHEETDFKPTGTTDVIAGMKAEQYVGTHDGKQIEVWVTKELGEFMMANKGAGNPFGGKAQKSQGWESFVKQGNFYPLRTIIHAKDGTEEFRMETTKIEKKSLEAALFAPPAGYEKFEMPSFGDAMKGLIPGSR